MSERSNSKRGLLDFLLQRLTSVVVAIYMVHLVIIFSINSDMNYVAWREYLTSGYALILASLAILSVVVHAWIGMWTIGTDYLSGTGMKKIGRLSYQVVVLIALALYMFWALGLIWGAR